MTMCVAELHSPSGALSRRSFVKLGAVTAATAALASQLGSRAAEAKAEGAPLFRVSIEHVVDLTHVLGPETPLLYPLLPKLGLVSLASFEKNGLYANQLIVSEHHGTHFDAPIHFAPEGLTTAEIPARALVAPAVVIDIRDKAVRDADAELTMDDVRAWEAQFGRIPEGAAVLLNSGWDRRFSDEDACRNVGPDGLGHYPGFSTQVATFLRDERSIVGIGTDTMNVDRGVNTTFDVHKTLMAVNRWMLEGVANLGEIPPAGAHLFVGAPKHAGGSGGPARVIAVW
jgi:kynurenine formamidase